MVERHAAGAGLEGGVVRLDLAGPAEAVREAQGDAPNSSPTGNPFIAMSRTPSCLAASFTRVLTDVVIELTRSVAPDGLRRLVAACSPARDSTPICARHSARKCRASPVPERAGLALGAALSCATRRRSRRGRGSISARLLLKNR